MIFPCNFRTIFIHITSKWQVRGYKKFTFELLEALSENWQTSKLEPITQIINGLLWLPTEESRIIKK